MKINPENVKGCGPPGYDWDRHTKLFSIIWRKKREKDFYIGLYIYYTHNILQREREDYIEIYRFGSARLSDRFHLYNDMGRPHNNI